MGTAGARAVEDPERMAKPVELLVGYRGSVMRPDDTRAVAALESLSV